MIGALYCNINPWSPVLAKKTVPKTLSAIEKGDSKYSYPWNPVKITANIIVIKKLTIALFLLPAIKAWWPYVINAKSPTI